MRYYYQYFGQAYGEGVYGNGKYSCSTEQQQNGTCTVASSGGGNSGLADTGIAVAIIVTLACFIVFVSLIVRIWRRKPRLQEADETDQVLDARNDPDKSN